MFSCSRFCAIVGNTLRGGEEESLCHELNVSAEEKRIMG